MFFFLCCHRCLWFVSRWMSDEESDASEEIDVKPSTVKISTDWSTQIGDSNSLLIPQQLLNLSRSSSSSSSSTDYPINNQVFDTHL